LNLGTSRDLGKKKDENTDTGWGKKRERRQPHFPKNRKKERESVKRFHAQKRGGKANYRAQRTRGEKKAWYLNQ